MHRSFVPMVRLAEARAFLYKKEPNSSAMSFRLNIRLLHDAKPFFPFIAKKF